MYSAVPNHKYDDDMYDDDETLETSSLLPEDAQLARLQEYFDEQFTILVAMAATITAAVLPLVHNTGDTTISLSSSHISAALHIGVILMRVQLLSVFIRARPLRRSMRLFLLCASCGCFTTAWVQYLFLLTHIRSLVTANPDAVLSMSTAIYCAGTILALQLWATCAIITNVKSRAREVFMMDIV